jgi:hypothetical protein
VQGKSDEQGEGQGSVGGGHGDGKGALAAILIVDPIQKAGQGLVRCR